MLPKSNPPCIREFMWPWCIILLNPASLGWTIWTLLSWVWENLGLGSGLPLYLSYNPNFLNWYELLKRLHWLLIEWWIRFKLACLVHKILNTGHPPYLTEFLQNHKPSRSTRSFASHLLSVLRHNLSFGARAFHVTAPKIWNFIPLHIHQSQTYSSFTRHLKTHYFLLTHLAP